MLRLMPNLPCVLQVGAAVFSRGTGVGDGDAALLQSLLSPCGMCEEVPEPYINIHTGLSGSGVAYVSTIHHIGVLSFFWDPLSSPLLFLCRCICSLKPWPRGL